MCDLHAEIVVDCKEFVFFVHINACFGSFGASMLTRSPRFGALVAPFISIDRFCACLSCGAVSVRLPFACKFVGIH